MKNKIVSDKTGLVQIPDGDGFLLGYIPTKQLFCLGSLTADFGDYFRKGEKTLIRFVSGKPQQVLGESINFEDYQIKENEVIVSFGNLFLAHQNFKIA